MQLLLNKDKTHSTTFIEAIENLRVNKLLSMDTRVIDKYITLSAEEIVARQQLLSDMLSTPFLEEVLTRVLESIRHLQDMDTKKQAYSDEIEQTLYSLLSLELLIDAVTLLADAHQKLQEHLTCNRWRAFFSFFSTARETEDFCSAKELLQELRCSIKTLKSITVGINLNAQLQPTEIGLVALNDSYFTARNIFTTLFKSNDAPIEYAAPLVTYNDPTGALERSLYITMNKNVCKALKKSQRALLQTLNQSLRPLFENGYEDISFLLKSAQCIKSFSSGYCFPAVESGKMDLSNLYDPLLAASIRSIDLVKNDVYFSDDSCLYLLNGANSGGKSVYVRAIGIAQILFQLGLGVPADKAQMRIVDGVYTHFPIAETHDHSQFAGECARMKDILNQLTGDSLLLMDETFSGTASAEGAAVAFQVLQHLQSRRCYCIFSTHMYEINSYLDRLNKRKPLIGSLYMETLDGKRTYRIQKGLSDGLSYAYDIAKRYGLEFSEEKLST